MPIDWTMALAYVDNDRKLLAELAAMFSQDSPGLLLKARDAIMGDDSSVLERVAHTLKGRLAFFGIDFLRDKASRLETMGRLRVLDDAQELLAEIQAEIERILPEFDALSREQGQ
jgi:HPt (histidine-containing phosphotransfer) domain-containing protein